MNATVNQIIPLVITDTLEQEFDNFLRDEIEQHCYKGSFDVYFDYRDRVDVETINNCFCEYLEDQRGYTKFSHYLEQCVDEKWSIWEYEHELINLIEEDAKLQSDEIQDMLSTHISEGDIWDDLCKVGYQGLQWSIFDIIPDIKINLLLATANEQNHDLSSINQCYTQGYQFRYDDPDKQANLVKELEDSALAYLVKQQGYDVPDNYIGSEDMACSDNRFLKSVADELYESYYDVCQCVTALATVGLSELDDFADVLLKRDNCKKEVTIKKDCYIGLFAPFIGGGSLLEIELDKDFTFPTSMLYDVQVESREKYSGIHGLWTVNSVFDLWGGCWNATLTIK